MYGVYLIDNETTFLKTMQESISWEENGFEVVGSNTDRATAISEIAALKPHLVVCGTERAVIQGFMKQVKEAGANCRFIVITKFWSPEMMGDFFYSGGYDFLLKPIDVAKADKSLKDLHKKLLAENRAL